MTKQTAEDIAAKKAEYIAYYATQPIQRLAAGWIGKDEDTILRWRKDDPEFAESIIKAESSWAQNKLGKVRNPEWLLSRVLKKDFSERTELTGADGKELIPLLNLDAIRRNHSDSQDSSPQQAD